MNHARKGRLVPRFFRLLAICIDRPHDHIQASIIPIPAGLVRKADHLARLGIKFGVRSERRRLDLALKVVPPERLERDGVHGERRAVLLGREEHAAPKRDIGVTRGANHPLYGLVVRPRVAVPPKQAPARRRLGLVAIRPDIALLEVGVAGVDADRGHGAVAVEVDVVLKERREPVVGLDPVKGAVDVLGDGPRHLEVEDVALEPRGLVHRPEHFGVGEGCRLAGRGELARRVARPLDGGREVEDVGHGACGWALKGVRVQHYLWIPLGR